MPAPRGASRGCTYARAITSRPGSCWPRSTRPRRRQWARGTARRTVEQALARRDLATAGGRREDVQAARDRVAAAEAALDEAKRHLDRTRVVAPVDGVVLARRVDEGDTVMASALALFD